MMDEDEAAEESAGLLAVGAAGADAGPLDDADTTDHAGAPPPASDAAPAPTLYDPGGPHPVPAESSTAGAATVEVPPCDDDAAPATAAAAPAKAKSRFLLMPYWRLLRTNPNFAFLFAANVIVELGNWCVAAGARAARSCRACARIPLRMHGA